jgi:hypothetical protein
MSDQEIIAPPDILSKARTYGITSLIFGIIAPGLIVVAFLLFIVLAAGTGGFGALGLAAAFSLFIPVASLIAIPLGIVAVIFGIKAIRTAKSIQKSKAPYIFPLCLGIVNIILPILLAVWLIPRGACIYDRNPGNAGCLALPIIPLSWQVSPQYLQHLQAEESGTPQPITSYPTSAPAQTQTYSNQNYGFSFTYPLNFSLSIESSSGSNSESITLRESNSNGVSATLFINQPYPTNTKAAASGIATVGFNASGTLQESDYSGITEYSQSGTYNPISGYDLTSPFTDSRGNTYYWEDAFSNWQQEQVGSGIIYSMKTL